MLTNNKVKNKILESVSRLETVVEKISDSYMAAGMDAFDAARKMYNYVKAAAESGVPGTDTIVDELRKRFYKRKSSSTRE
jgi:hypothetical protein